MKNIFLILLMLFTMVTYSQSKDLKDLEKVFIEKRCITCHVIGRGRFVGPDLYYSLDKYSKEEVLQWIQNPQSIYKKYAKMPINDGYPPMPYINVNKDEAGKLLKYIERTKELVKRGSKVKISGKVQSFSTKEFLDNQEVELELVMADKVKSSMKVSTVKGDFNFDKLEGNISYRIKIFYDGIEYSTDKFYFLPDEYEKVVDLIVYDSTQDYENLYLDSGHLIISYDEDSNSIVVAEIFNISNNSSEIFIGTNDFSEKQRKINSYALFPEVTDLSFPHRSESTFIVSKDKVTDTLPMPPGNRRVVLTYAKELNFFSTKLSKVFLNNISSLTIIVPENKLSLSIEGLNFVKKDSPIAELANDEYTTYSISNINKGDEINLVFRKYGIFKETKTIIFAVFTLFIVGILLYKRFKKT